MIGVCQTINDQNSQWLRYHCKRQVRQALEVAIAGQDYRLHLGLGRSSLIEVLAIASVDEYEASGASHRLLEFERSASDQIVSIISLCRDGTSNSLTKQTLLASCNATEEEPVEVKAANGGSS